MPDQIHQNFIKVNADGSVTFDFAIVADQRVVFPFGIDVDQGADIDVVTATLYQAPGALELEAGADGVYASAGTHTRLIINTLGQSDYIQHLGPVGTINVGNDTVTIPANQLVSNTLTIPHGISGVPTAIAFGPAHPGVNDNLIAAFSLHHSNVDADSFNVQARAAAAQTFSRNASFSWIATA